MSKKPNYRGPPHCSRCGQFVGKDHNCAGVDLKGQRFCSGCDKPLSNIGYERWKHRCPSCEKKYWRDMDRKLRHQLVIQFGSRCNICGYDRYEICLEFHHINTSDKRSKHFLKDIMRNPESFRLLCNRCHRELHTKEANGQ